MVIKKIELKNILTTKGKYFQEQENYWKKK